MSYLGRILVGLGAVALVGCGPQQQPQRSAEASSQAATQPAEPPPPKPAPIDLKTTHLERVDFTGLPPQEALDSVMRLNPDREKYESDAEHAKRMKDAESSELLEGIKVSDRVAFAPSSVRFTYDANRQEWQYQVSPSEVGYSFSNIEVYSQTLPAAQFPEYASVYPGKQLVFKRSIHLHVSSLKGLSYIVGAFKVPRTEARELEDLLSVVLVGHLTPVRVTSHRALPVHYDEHEVNLQTAMDFRLEGVWLVNKRDGQVVSKTWKVRRDA